MPDGEVMNKECHAHYVIWERVIKDGNRDFDADVFEGARLKYLRAVELAVAMVESEPCIRPTIGALLVSYHNLADLYERHGFPLFALNALSSVFQHVEHLQRANPAETAPVWGKRIASEQLYLFKKRHGEAEEFQRPAFIAIKPDDISTHQRSLH